MALSKYKLGDLIAPEDERNYEGRYTLEDVRGISIQKVFIETKADMKGVSLSPYILVKPDSFAYVTVTSRNGEKITIAHNDTERTFIVSSSYVVFTVKRKDLLNSDYLFMYFNRPEFNRYSRFNSWGSARETFSWEAMCDIDIELPDLTVQQKYVDIYNAMVANQQSYERGLEDLKLVCDGYIEDLRRNMPCEKIGPFIAPKDERNSDLSVKLAQGITIDKQFANPKQVAQIETNAKIVRKGQFAYNRATTRNGEKISIAYRDGEDCVVSSAYQVFEIVSTDKLLPSYLMMWYKRSEFDRYARYMSKGSAHEFFEYEDMCEVAIPIPSIEVQKAIAEIYDVYTIRKRINAQLKAQIKDICPILIKGSLEEGMKVEDLFNWTIKKLQITTLGFQYSQKHPFGFNYPCKEDFQLAHEHKEGTIYEGVLLPNEDVINTEFIEQKYNSDSVQLAIIELAKVLPVFDFRDADWNTVLCLFSLLHEIGHYVHFLSFSNEEEYIAFCKDYQTKKKTIDFDRRNLNDEERMKCEKQYWELPGEKEAYSFALQNIVPVLIEYWRETGFPVLKNNKQMKLQIEPLDCN